MDGRASVTKDEERVPRQRSKRQKVNNFLVGFDEFFISISMFY